MTGEEGVKVFLSSWHSNDLSDFEVKKISRISWFYNNSCISSLASPSYSYRFFFWREVGPEALSDTELLAILISSGIPGKPAEKIAEEIIERFGSFKGMANQPLNKFLQTKGLAIDKIIAS
ncbi:unnamed protein product [marine sediment metagenome]|uniref:UPF0758 domain-containing protein n=1 Tax=marine sediment metagenome TaxID=412755 RepID=X1FTH8_9ZZZZ